MVAYPPEENTQKKVVMDAQEARGGVLLENTGQPLKKGKRAIIQSIVDGAGNRIYLPPRKKKEYSKCLVLRFVITGTIPAKKNRQVPRNNINKIRGIVNSYHRSTPKLIEELSRVKPYIQPAKKYVEWEEKVSADILLQAERWRKTYESHGLIYPISKASISVYHYWADPKARDNDNRQESINDMLVKSGIILNDTWQNLSPTSSDADLYKGEIHDHITIVTITAYL